MAKEVKSKRKPRQRFKQVDVYVPKFGLIAEKAVYDVFQDTFKVETHNMKKHSFQHCVKALRRLDLEKLEQYRNSLEREYKKI